MGSDAILGDGLNSMLNACGVELAEAVSVQALRLTAFIVDAGNPGLHVGRNEHKLGIRASSTCEVSFTDCVVEREAVLGGVGNGYKIAIGLLNEGRIGIAFQTVGLAQGAFNHAMEVRST